MKAATLSNRPDFSLMKQTDIQSFYHLQMPRWLFFDKKYMPLSLEAKVTYTFLLNRFQLSKLNNWINGEGEVFVIYTRESLAAEMQISYRRVIGCMKELAAMSLIWERRCGRGDANQIYLAQVELTNESASVYSSAPFVTPGDEAADSRPADIAYLDVPNEAGNIEGAEKSADLRPVETACLDDADVTIYIPDSAPVQEVPIPQVKECETGTSAPDDSTCQDLQNPHPSNIDKNYIDYSDTDKSQSVGLLPHSSPHTREAGSGGSGGQAEDIAELDKILESCDLWTFPPITAKVFENAIERLWFSENVKIGKAVLPQRKVRSHLYELDNIRLQEAERKIRSNTSRKVKNSTAYVMAVIFNTIWECESDVMADPYLNSLRDDGGGP